MAEKIAYDVTLMDEITQKYDSCSKAAANIILNMYYIKQVFMDSYTGQAEVIVSDSITKIIGHLALLRDCCTNAGAFVSHTKEEMVKSDENVIDAVSGAAQGGK
jgi:hypothetical protein